MNTNNLKTLNTAHVILLGVVGIATLANALIGGKIQQIQIDNAVVKHMGQQ